MSDFVVMLHITAASMADAMQVRDEAVMGLEDARDSGELAAGATFSMGELHEVTEPTHVAMINAAREVHGSSSDNAVEVYDDARISESDDGVFVEAWVWLNWETLKQHGIEPPADEEEGNG